MPFRINAKNFFLTYAQCTLEKQSIIDFFTGLLPVPSWGIVAEEKHQDGNTHFHAIIGYSDKRDIRSDRYFDIENFHPNIQSVRSLKACAKYVTKDGNTLSFGVIPEALLQNSWGDIIANSTSPRSCLRSVLLSYPKEYATRYQAIEYMAERHFKKRRVDYVSEFTEFDTPVQLDEWITNEFEANHPRRKSLILVSPSRYGKTEWARSLGHHMYFNGMVNFKHDWDDDASYIVFDDIDWEYIPNKKCFLGGQRQFVITDKYAGKRTVEWNKVCIYLCNTLPNFGSLTDWISYNCVILHLDKPLF